MVPLGGCNELKEDIAIKLWEGLTLVGVVQLGLGGNTILPIPHEKY
jgi:hypothetical protein